ncbi:MAG: hypothetical protein IKO47_08115 [Ruminococcus sp.]|nr:hypothetical protein [Ruminococcus sp.]
MKRIPLIIALAMLTGSLWSCGSSSSSSEETTGTSAASTAAASASTEAEEDTTEETSAEKTSEADTTEETSAGTESSSEKEIHSEQYKTGDGLFKFRVPDTLSKNDNDIIEDSEFKFDNGQDAVIGISSYGGLHYTAKGFAEGLVPDFENEFSDVSCEETEMNGQPAEKLSAFMEKNGERYVFDTYFIQYGNGELFSLAYAYPSSSSYSISQDVQFILDSVEFTGSELKKRAANYTGKGFDMKIDEKFYIKSKDDYNVTVKYNLVDSIDEYTASMKISAEKVDDVKANADDIYSKWQAHKSTENIGRDTAEFLGRQADHIYRTVTVSGVRLSTEYYIFKDGDTTIAATLTIPEKISDKFLSDIQPLLDSVRVK